MSKSTAEAHLSVLHHGSHSSLLSRVETRTAADVDAIIVPTSRPVAYLRKALALGVELGCPVVALCSHRATASGSVAEARKFGTKILAIDTANLPVTAMPTFDTSVNLQRTRFEQASDLSLKRNAGLLLADLIGWERIVFLDDDITVPRPEDLRDAAGLLSSHAAVGLANDGYHDNSVVCHAYRDAGGAQESFVGGGALAVGSDSFQSFFPNIYSEDWFFLVDKDDRLRRTAVVGRAVQSDYDPFSDDRRARAEEFGDTIAEGLYALLDAGLRVQQADVPYWREFLRKRRLFISEVIDMVIMSDLEEAAKIRRIVALKAARGRSMLITPELCADYLGWWRADRDRWTLHLEDIRFKHGSGLKPEKALAALGLMHCSQTAL